MACAPAQFSGKKEIIIKREYFEHIQRNIFLKNMCQDVEIFVVV